MILGLFRQGQNDKRLIGHLSFINILYQGLMEVCNDCQKIYCVMSHSNIGLGTLYYLNVPESDP